MNKKNGIIAVLLASVGTGSVALFSPETLASVVSPETLENVVPYLSDAVQSQFSKNLFIFSLAAVIHSGRMKKEIRSNFEMLVTSIDNVSKSFHEKLDGLENRVETLEANNKSKQSMKETIQ